MNSVITKGVERLQEINAHISLDNWAWNEESKLLFADEKLFDHSNLILLAVGPKNDGKPLRNTLLCNLNQMTIPTIGQESWPISTIHSDEKIINGISHELPAVIICLNGQAKIMVSEDGKKFSEFKIVKKLGKAIIDSDTIYRIEATPGSALIWKIG